MENTLLNRFNLKEAQVFEQHSVVVPGSELIFSRQDEQHLYKIQAFECNGEYGPYKALKILFKIDNKFQELNPWPVLDYKSSNMVEHMQEIKPMYVEFYQAKNLTTGEIRNRVRIKPFATPQDEAKALEAWNKRP